MSKVFISWWKQTKEVKKAQLEKVLKYELDTEILVICTENGPLKQKYHWK